MEAERAAFPTFVSFLLGAKYVQVRRVAMLCILLRFVQNPTLLHSVFRFIHRLQQ
jgi:hypothetical protein